MMRLWLQGLFSSILNHSCALPIGHAPAFQVERSDRLGGISHRIKQGGHQDDGAAAAALAIYVKTDLTQGERIGQGSKLLPGSRPWCPGQAFSS